MLALLAGIAVPAFGGERFTITDSTNAIPILSEKQPALPEGSFLGSPISGGESVQGPPVPPQPVPILIPSSKLEELLDQKKNWAFQTPNTVDRNRAFEETLGVRKYELNGIDRKPRNSVERFMQGDRDSKDTATDRTSRESTKRDPLGRRDSLDSEEPDDVGDRLGSQRSGIIEELNPAYLFDWDLAPTTRGPFGESMRVNSLFPQPPAGPAAAQRLPGQPIPGQTAGSSSLTREFNSRTPLGRINDPINDPIDPTRSVLNPISARRASTPASASGASKASDSLGFGGSSPLSTRPDFFGGSQIRPFGTPASRPAVSAPSTPPPQPKPMILEIPRPKF